MILPAEWDEKPLLPVSVSSTPSTSPPTSRTSSPPPHLSHKPPLQLARSFLTGKRRLGLIVGAALYVVFGLAWYNGSHPRFGRGGFSGPHDNERPGHGGGYAPPREALYETPPIWLGPESLDKAAAPEPVVEKPLSQLGKEADDVYKLGGLDGLAYKAELEAFVKTHFPAADSDESDPHSLLNDMRAYFPSPGPRETNRIVPTIPERLWQTAATHGKYHDKEEATSSFLNMHEDLNVTFHDDVTADAWVRSRFERAAAEVPNGAARMPTGVVKAWDRLSCVSPWPRHRVTANT